MFQQRISSDIETDACIDGDLSTYTSSDIIEDVEFSSPERICPHLSPCSRCRESSFWVKYIFFGLNFALLIAGCIMSVIGSVVKVQRQSYGKLEDIYTDSLWLIIAVGVIIFICSVIGCVGALRENITFLKIFIIITGVVFLLESATGIMAFVLITNMEENVQKMLYKSIISYNKDIHSTDLIDRVQSSLRCCGVETYNDWEQNFDFNCSTSQISSCGVPKSCCKVASHFACGYQVRKFLTSYAKAFIHTNGCMSILINQFKSNLVIIGLVAFCVGVLEIVTMMLAHLQIRQTLLYTQKILI